MLPEKAERNRTEKKIIPENILVLAKHEEFSNFVCCEIEEQNGVEHACGRLFCLTVQQVPEEGHGLFQKEKKIKKRINKIVSV